MRERASLVRADGRDQPGPAGLAARPARRGLGGARWRPASIRDALIAASGAQAARLWKMRESLAEAQVSAGGSIAHDVSVPVSRIPEFIARADAAVEAACPGIRRCAFGHVGDGNMHYNPDPPAGLGLARFRAGSAPHQPHRARHRRRPGRLHQCRARHRPLAAGRARALQGTGRARHDAGASSARSIRAASSRRAVSMRFSRKSGPCSRMASDACAEKACAVSARYTSSPYNSTSGRRVLTTGSPARKYS